MTVLKILFFFAIFLLLVDSPTLAQAPEASSPETDSWTLEHKTALTGSCKNFTIQTWQALYLKTASDIYLQVKTLTAEKVNAMEANPFLEFVETVAPYHLPKNFRMRTTFLDCIEPMTDFKEAQTKKSRIESLTKWEACLGDEPSIEKDLSACIQTILKNSALTH